MRENIKCLTKITSYFLLPLNTAQLTLFHLTWGNVYPGLLVGVFYYKCYCSNPTYINDM